MVSEVFEKLVNNKLIDHLENFFFFSDFQYVCRSSQSTVYLQTVVSDRIAKAFKRCGAS